IGSIADARPELRDRRVTRRVWLNDLLDGPKTEDEADGSCLGVRVVGFVFACARPRRVLHRSRGRRILVYRSRTRRGRCRRGLHYWFKDCLERAGLPSTIKRNLTMAQFVWGEEVWLVSGIPASQLDITSII